MATLNCDTKKDSSSRLYGLDSFQKELPEFLYHISGQCSFSLA